MLKDAFGRFVATRNQAQNVDFLLALQNGSRLLLFGESGKGSAQRITDEQYYGNHNQCDLEDPSST
jgi:hypothetical protein